MRKSYGRHLRRRDRPRRFKAAKPAAQRRPPAEQEEHVEGKGARLEADSIAVHDGACGFTSSGTSWYHSFAVGGDS